MTKLHEESIRKEQENLPKGAKFFLVSLCLPRITMHKYNTLLEVVKANKNIDEVGCGNFCSKWHFVGMKTKEGANYFRKTERVRRGDKIVVEDNWYDLDMNLKSIK